MIYLRRAAVLEDQLCVGVEIARLDGLVVVALHSLIADHQQLEISVGVGDPLPNESAQVTHLLLRLEVALKGSDESQFPRCYQHADL